jgi:hypothetical protein
MPLIFCAFYFDSPGLSTLLSTPAASFRIVPIRQPELQFIPIAFRISEFVSLRIVAFGPRPLSFAFDLFACLLLAFDPSSCSSFPSTSAACFRVVAFRFRLRPLRLRALAFDVPGVVSLAFGLADSKFLCIRFLFLPHRFVPLRSRLPWITIFPFAFDTLGCVSFTPLHSASLVSFRCASLRSLWSACWHTTSSLFISFRMDSYRCVFNLQPFALLPSTMDLSGRPVLRPQGRGVGHRRQNKTPKTPKTPNQQKKNRNNHDAAKAQSLDAQLQRTKLSAYYKCQGFS